MCGSGGAFAASKRAHLQVKQVQSCMVVLQVGGGVVCDIARHVRFEDAGLHAQRVFFSITRSLAEGAPCNGPSVFWHSISTFGCFAGSGLQFALFGGDGFVD